MSDGVEVPGELVDALISTTAQIKQLTETANTLKGAIKTLMGENEFATVGGEQVVRWAHVKSRRLDMHQLRSQIDPAVLAGCYVEEMTRRFIPLIKAEG